MFENKIKEEIKNILELYENEDKVYLKFILENEQIDRAYRNYYESFILNQIYIKNIERKADKYFDMDDSEMAALWKEIDQIYFIKAIFYKKDFETITETAVKLRLNFLCRPRTTLNLFCMQSDQALPLQEIMRKLDYFTDYNYLTVSLKEELENIIDNRVLVTSGEFKNFVESADNNYIFNLTTEQLADLLEPMSDFFENHVPKEALMIFFDDKSLSRLSVKLNAYASENGKDYFDLNDIKEFLSIEYNKALTNQKPANAITYEEKEREREDAGEEIPDTEEEKVPELDDDEAEEHEHIIPDDEDQLNDDKPSDEESVKNKELPDIIEDQLDDLDKVEDKNSDIDPELINEELSGKEPEKRENK